MIYDYRWQEWYVMICYGPLRMYDYDLIPFNTGWFMMVEYHTWPISVVPLVHNFHLFPETAQVSSEMICRTGEREVFIG